MNYDQHKLNIFYCCSDFFSEVCAVSIVSLFENNQHFDAIHIFILGDHVSEKNKGKIQELAKRYHRDITFLPMPELSNFYDDKRFTTTSLGHSFGRLIIADVVPKNINRILSLDCDTMVFDRLDELWNSNLSKHPIAGVDDCMGRVAMVKTQNLKTDSIHCNAGMYIIDLDVWRHEEWTHNFYNYINSIFTSGRSLGGYEEEVITNVLGDRMLVLHPKFNLMTLEQVLSYNQCIAFRQPLNYYSKDEIDDALRTPVITHTTNLFYVRKRVFEQDSDHPMRKQYVNYRAMTAWADDPPMKVQYSLKHTLMKGIWHVFPKSIAIYIARFVRNDIRPRLASKRDDE
jgi:lipopolysaccharide biosynthesis glycosyltransferase